MRRPNIGDRVWGGDPGSAWVSRPCPVLRLNRLTVTVGIHWDTVELRWFITERIPYEQIKGVEPA